MKHFFRSLSAVLTAAGIFVFSVIVYGNSTVSDSVESIDGVSGFANQFLSIGKENVVKASGFTNSDGGYKANLMAELSNTYGYSFTCICSFTAFRRSYQSVSPIL